MGDEERPQGSRAHAAAELQKENGRTLKAKPEGPAVNKAAKQGVECPPAEADEALAPKEQEATRIPDTPRDSPRERGIQETT